MLWIGFFFLLRPGEYCNAGSNNTSTPFRLQGVIFCQVQTILPAATAPLSALIRTNHVSLIFSTQKNGVQGKCIGHQASSHPTECPVQRCLHQTCYLCRHGAPCSTPLGSFHEGGHWKTLPSKHVTAIIRLAVTVIPNCSLDPTNVYAQSLRASGAMELLLAGIDGNVLKLTG